MIYGKTEERVLSYLPVIKKRMYRTEGSFPSVFVQHYKEYTEIKDGEEEEITSYPYAFGKEGNDSVFSFSLSVPKIEEDIYLFFPLETDSLLLVNGEPHSGVNPRHQIISLNFFKGERIKGEIKAWNGYIFPGCHPLLDTHLLTTVGESKKDYPIYLEKPSLLIKNEEQYNLYYDVLTLTDLALCCNKGSMEREVIFSTLKKALSLYPYCSEDREECEKRAEEVRGLIQPLLSSQNGTIAPSSYSVGMAHLDHAWLWPIRETERKADRTISSMTALMEEYPEFVFLSTQPVQAEGTFSRYPTLRDKVLRAYERGQWEPNGGGLVEADNMLSSGEGLIRNFLYGKECTKELFPDYTPTTYVVPDSFGYNGNLPQILKGCGIPYFITSKLSWNDTNHFPYEKFIWRGIDGSEVKAYMIPGSYNGENKPSFISSMWNKVSNKDIQDAQILTIGEGDGGGGTTRDDIEILRRLENLQGCPRASWSRVSDSLSKIFSSSDDIPVYTGELYFELHRGTYTSQARTKQGYRRVLSLLHNAEYLLALSWAEKRDDALIKSLQKEVKGIWRQTVVYQFHDILPGSAVRPVYEETERFFASSILRLEEIMGIIAGSGKKRLNLTPFSEDGIEPYSSGKGKKETEDAVREGETITAPWGSVTLSPDGSFSSLLYKGREIVSSSFNTLLMGEDVPLSWDAWDIEKDSVDGLKPLYLPEDGRMVRKGRIGRKSELKQSITVHVDKARIDFVTEVDWEEDHQLLKAGFDTTIRSQNAFYDIPFGFVSRSTENNNSIEWAQFEVPAEKFVSVSDNETTLALISDSKYGFSAKNGHLSVSLLKSAKAPDASADMGKHRFMYSLYITEGGIKDVIREAEIISNPLISGEKELQPLLAVSEGLLLETVKIGEDGESIIFRVREYLGTARKGRLTFSPLLDKTTLRECMMTEERDWAPEFDFHPFEVKTYKIKRA